jgi:O-acetyl-ADP-ribose deacetylase (regulator of RNase III)
MAKLIYRKGDLLAAPEPIIAHGCNAQGVMGAGVAALIRKRWPKAYEAYRNRYEEHGLTPGEIVVADVDGKAIANAVTQATQGMEPIRYVSYDALADCMAKIARYAMEHGHAAVAMPRIGAGLANGDWAIIERIIERQLVAAGVDVVVYEL